MPGLQLSIGQGYASGWGGSGGGTQYLARAVPAGQLAVVASKAPIRVEAMAIGDGIRRVGTG